MSIVRTLLSFSLCLTLVVGCGGPSRPGVVPAGGTVTLDGGAVEGAVVTLVPEGETSGATGKTDASGNFVLSTYGGGDGAIVGKYKVTVIKYPPEPEVKLPKGVDPNDPEAGEYAAPDAFDMQEDADDDPGAAPPVAESLLPEKYASENTSGLTAEVTDGENQFTFALTSN